MRECFPVVGMIMKIYYNLQGQHFMGYLADSMLEIIALDVLTTDMSRFLNISIYVKRCFKEGIVSILISVRS